MARGKHSQLGEGCGLVKGMEETSGSNKNGKPSKQTSILFQKALGINNCFSMSSNLNNPQLLVYVFLITQLYPGVQQVRGGVSIHKETGMALIAQNLFFKWK